VETLNAAQSNPILYLLIYLRFLFKQLTLEIRELLQVRLVEVKFRKLLVYGKSRTATNGLQDSLPGAQPTPSKH